MMSFLSLSQVPFQNNYPFDVPECNVSAIQSAIASQAYPTLYSALRKQRQPLSPAAAFVLCDQVIENGLNKRALAAILDVSPPLEDFARGQFLTNPFPNGRLGLAEHCAASDRPDLLALLLDRGCPLNGIPGAEVTPLEAAFVCQSLHCLELLIRRPGLEASWTPRLLDAWCQTDSGSPMQDFCRQTLSPLLFGRALDPMEPMPLPPALEARYPARHRNWALLKRLCRERKRIPLKEGRKALAALPDDKELVPPPVSREASEALEALLEACPGLPRQEAGCRVLLRYYLALEDRDRPRLAPWAEDLRDRMVVMEPSDWDREDWDSFLDRWQDLFPQGPVLALDRWARWCAPALHFTQFFIQDEATAAARLLDRVLDACPVRGKGAPGRLSPLAELVLTWGSPTRTERCLQPGGLLATEDRDALLAFAQQDRCPRLNRLAVLAYTKKEADYAL